MCGIVGYWNMFGTQSEKLRSRLPAATRTLHHRGPDAQGTWWANESLGMGHRRLSIIDLSKAGNQPMVTEDGRLAIVFNGEIYNYKDLASKLSKRGHQFKSHSDTEVILASYREWGSACIEHFIGMFAFALWDSERRKLFLFRDRAGVKPLYWGWDGETLVFASELKALRQLSATPPVVNFEAVGEYLQYGYIAQPRSAYADVHKLPSASFLTIQEGGQPCITPYWSLADAAAARLPVSNEEDAIDQLETLLLDSLKHRLIADVPIGLFLSGGLDSASLACMAARLGVDIQTYTIGSRTPNLDEAPAAVGIARRLGLRHSVQYLEQENIAASLDNWSSLFDEPFSDGSGVPMYFLSCLAQSDVKVALSGDGGDELFCGYNGYKEMSARMGWHDATPYLLRKSLAKAIEFTAPLLQHRLPISGNARMSMFADRANKMSGYLHASSRLDAIRPFRSVWQPKEIHNLIGQPYVDPRCGSVRWEGSGIEQIAALDFMEYLQEDVLTKVDRSSMAVGLECREPFLDQSLIAFAYSLPANLRIGTAGSKHILRKLLYRYLPRELVDAPKKGFSVPIAEWTKQAILDGSLITSKGALVDKLGFKESALDRAVSIHTSSAQGLNRIWALHILGKWANHWI
jgi:asparagine synthase (glutamine-hydrolysing)